MSFWTLLLARRSVNWTPQHQKSCTRYFITVLSTQIRVMELLSSLSSGSAPAPKLNQLPPEMLHFTLIKTTGALTPRLGCLSLPKRKSISTPNFVGNTSRGIIPHISQDNFSKSLNLNGVYVALEDCKHTFAAIDVALR